MCVYSIHPTGCARTLSSIINKETGLKTRAIEFSTLQRTATHIASLRDIDEAFMVGSYAVDALNNHETGKMVIINRDNKKEYSSSVSLFDINSIANVEKKIPLEWIDIKNNQLKDDFLKYCKPLIAGELYPIFKNGLPCHLVRK